MVSSPWSALPIQNLTYITMDIYKIKRTWKTDKVRGYCFQTKLYVFGIPVVRIVRRSTKKVYFCGILVYSKQLYRQTGLEKLTHLQKIGYDPMKLPPAQGLARVQQLASLQLLRKVAEVCRKHNIRWWLDYGTLLGAVRHGGFIPWDDDIDIAMLREDWEKFRDIFAQEFDTSMFSMNNQGFLQVHYRHLPIQVDIFPFDRMPCAWNADDSVQERGFVDKFIHSASLLEYDIDLSKDQDYCVSSHTYEQVRELSREIMCDGKDAVENGQLFLAIEAHYTKVYSRPDRWIFPLQTLTFEGHIFPAPAVPELILFREYGDWGQLPDNPVAHFSLQGLGCADVETMLRIAREGF